MTLNVDFFNAYRDQKLKAEDVFLICLTLRRTQSLSGSCNPLQLFMILEWIKDIKQARNLNISLNWDP